MRFSKNWSWKKNCTPKGIIPEALKSWKICMNPLGTKTIDSLK
ncbi:MAG: hypothetical protein ACI8ZM_001106 [Crocinitomix sp.]|jgi:hypothetical protein